MIIQIDFEAKSDSGNLKGRFKLNCKDTAEAKEWLMIEIESYNMELVGGAEFAVVPDEYLDESEIKDVIDVR